ncbi:hypothetical protein [Elizabethkingia ursingii]|jgi:YHS domain-containing protein|uniref:MlpB protein n=1 Tax=Elizabethkingia ursingii TaxID=1756150 RepID=A0AAJ3TN45_9FLAO|nr:hypothetical protein [Elizabethkingia ursingii]AQX07927.1 hypothetical protein BBD34_04395 [Elizabethkingia ursingii]OPB73720.1 hypothetical protein BAY32_11830 [Elizabethkingia ursingii]OPB88747.1 hypothetical protein BB021_05045 [Elizabethkingia ursingii]
MKAMLRNTSLIIFSSVILYACNTDKPKNNTQAMADQMTTTPSDGKYAKGDKVPNETVCMVNDAYMGKKQIEVPHDGKTYYGCCEMCVERIPKDKSVREATDPFSGEKIDKANAYIVMVGDNGEVAYFKNEENYKKFVAKNS